MQEIYRIEKREGELFNPVQYPYMLTHMVFAYNFIGLKIYALWFMKYIYRHVLLMYSCAL